MTELQYIGGLGNNTLYRQRPYVKVGTGADNTTYRGVFTFQPKPQIEAALNSVGISYSADSSYKIGKADLSLTSTTALIEPPDLYAVLMPLGASVDDSVSWEKHSEFHGTNWENTGGDIEPAASGILVKGSWNSTINPTTITFDITQYLSIWKTSEPSSISVAVIDDGTPKDILKFYSSESQDIRIGGSALSNCRFFTGSESQTTAIEGVRVMITPTGNTAEIVVVDQSCEAEKRWSTFYAAATVGSTCSIFSPDYEQGLVIGSVICAITDKVVGERGSAIVVSGLSLGTVKQYYTTAEFSTQKNINTGYGFVELTNPDEQTLKDIAGLKPNDIVNVQYPATVSQNNVRQYTVRYTADEKSLNNRARIYFNEQVVSEDRNGKRTELIVPTLHPSLDLQIIV